jgi:RNA polymerase sigma-70 factor (ECF subfamily)
VANADVLFAEHQAGVFRYLRRVLGQVDAAHDLTQEVFLRVSRAGVPEASDDARRAWVFRIARNLALNHLRDTRRRPETTEAVELTRPPTQEIALALDRALAALADLDRDVFLLRESGGLSYGEIAAACEITPDAVRSRLHRARQQLRDELSAPVAEQRIRGIRLGS